LGTFLGLPKLLISKTINFIFSQNIPPSHVPKPCQTDQLSHVQYTSKLNILAPRILWYSFGGHSNLHILKTMNFFFSKNTPPSHLPKPWHTDQFGQVQNVPNSKYLCTNNFMVLMLGHLEAIPTFTSQKPWISFFHKIPHQAIYLSRAIPTNLAMFKTHRTQNIGAPRILRYSFGALGGHSHLYISKTMNFIFSENTPPSHLLKPWHTDQFGHVQNVPNSKHLCTNKFMVLMLGHLEAIPTFTSQKPWISFFHKIPHEAIYLSRATPTNLAMFKTHRTQNIRAPRILWYSCWDIWRQFQPSNLKNREFHFFTKYPTKPFT